MVNVLLELKKIVRKQRNGSDYDELYFGVKDIIDLLEAEE